MLAAPVSAGTFPSHCTVARSVICDPTTVASAKTAACCEPPQGFPGARCGLESSGRRCDLWPEHVCRPQARLHPPQLHSSRSQCVLVSGWGGTGVCREWDRQAGTGRPGTWSGCPRTPLELSRAGVGRTSASCHPRPLALLPRGPPWVGAPRALTCPHLSSFRDIAKNALLHWRVFIYWTLLGLFDALVFFFGAYFMFENTTVTSNGQVRVGLGCGDRAAGSGVKLEMAQAWHGRRGQHLGVCRRWSGPNGRALPAAGTPFSGQAGPTFIAYSSPSVIYLGVQLSHPDVAYLIWEII